MLSMTRRRVAFFCVFNAAFTVLNIIIWNYEPQRQSSHYVVVKEIHRRHGDSVAQVPPRIEPNYEATSAQTIAVDRLRMMLSNSSMSGTGTEGGYRKIDKPPMPDVLQETMVKSVERPYVTWSTGYENYKVPRFTYTELVKCSALLAGDSNELAKAERVMKSIPKVPIYEENYLQWTKNCTQFRRNRGYVEMALSAEEEQFPLAFSIAMYTDVEQTERLLRAIYQPQNLYCIHVDTKSPLLLHHTVAAIARCFDNVWISTHLDKIKWGDVSVLLPEINCMKDLVRYFRRRYRYFINLTGQEFPLRTNLELVRIARIFNGSNDIAGSQSRMDMERVRYHWTHRWSKTYQQTIFYNTFLPKPPFRVNLTFYKGELHGLFSRGMVEYLVENELASSYLKWCWDSGHPSEHYWNTLNYNTFLRVPGGYTGPLNEAERYSPEPAIRAKHWIGLYGDRPCHGKEQRGICVYGVGDLSWLHTRRELFANKFQLTYEYLTLDCLEERHRNRTVTRRLANDFDEQFFRGLPTVKYGRKDGLMTT